MIKPPIVNPTLANTSPNWLQYNVILLKCDLNHIKFLNGFLGGFYGA